MAKHLVKCKVCGQSFDLNSIQGVRCGTNRYAHQSCFPEGEMVSMGPPPDEDYLKLREYVEKLFHGDVNWGIVNKQIKTYKEENNYTYSGMLKSLVYAYEIKHSDITKARGVGSIPYYYQEAYRYYYSIWEAQQKNINFKREDYHIPEKIIKIPVPQRKVKVRKLFGFLDEETEE